MPSSLDNGWFVILSPTNRNFCTLGLRFLANNSTKKYENNNYFGSMILKKYCTGCFSPNDFIIYVACLLPNGIHHFSSLLDKAPKYLVGCVIQKRFTYWNIFFHGYYLWNVPRLPVPWRKRSFLKLPWFPVIVPVTSHIRTKSIHLKNTFCDQSVLVGCFIQKR